MAQLATEFREKPRQNSENAQKLQELVVASRKAVAKGGQNGIKTAPFPTLALQRDNTVVCSVGGIPCTNEEIAEMNVVASKHALWK